MASEHLRRLWREAQQRRREKLARLGITGKRKAHKPSRDHPWVKEGQAAAARREQSIDIEEREDDGWRLTNETLWRELGYY